MYNRLDEVKRQHECQKKIDYFGATLHPRDVDWLIEQTRILHRIETTLEAFENNGTEEDANVFYTIVRGILKPKTK